MRAAGIVAAAVLAGCIPLRTMNTRAPLTLASPDACDRTERAVMGWTATAAATGILGGSSGVTSLLTDSTPRYVVGGIGISLSTLAAVSTYLSTAYAQKFVRDCTQEAP